MDSSGLILGVTILTPPYVRSAEGVEFSAMVGLIVGNLKCFHLSPFLRRPAKPFVQTDWHAFREPAYAWSHTTHAVVHDIADLTVRESRQHVTIARYIRVA
jgi:hypothetical protein